MNYRMIKYVLGWILIFETMFLSVPLITAAIYSEAEFWHFLATMAVCAAAGGLLILKKPRDSTLYSREGALIVAFSWIALSIFGALPFYISGAIPSYLDALFETVSGFTTTGASILSDVEALPKCMMMWRSFTHWIGGMGVLVFIMAFLPLSGAYNMNIMKAESPGPSVSKLVPRVRTTALILYCIYIALTLIQFICLLIAKMDLFDAINTAFATAGTGGFAIKNSGMDGYSPAIQIIVTVFMLIFSVNFNSYYLLIRGKLKDVLNSEVKWFFIIVFVAIGAITLNVHDLFATTGEALRHSAFTVASIISTTGFATKDFNLWPELSRTFIVILMFVGACAGSTGGGFKVSRFIILFKGMGREIRRTIHPKKVELVSIDSRPVENKTVMAVGMYLVCYAAIFVFSIILLAFENSGHVTGFTAVASCLNNIGPGLEMVGPTANFGFFSPFSKIVLIFDMLAGRLELFPILLLFTPSTWKK